MDKLPRIEAKKSLGQHFLNNPKVPGRMADAAEVKEGDMVLEIGPGTGVLTRELLSRGAMVIAIEADARAIDALKEAFAEEIMAQKLIILHEDVRTLTLASLSEYIKPYAYKVVSNIPYYLSGMLFRIFLESDFQPSNLVFLVQKEVAERIARDPKESLLSLSIKVFGDPHYIKTIGKGNFTPPPKVDSAIIAVEYISKKRLDGLEETTFFKILHVGFASKRKQLLGNLTTLLPRTELMHIFSTLHIPEAIRGEDLSLENWIALCKCISPKIITV